MSLFMFDTLLLAISSKGSQYSSSLSLGKTYDNYDHITKILRSLPRRWRPQVTALRASKDLKKLPMEEFLGTFEVHKMVLNKDKGQPKGNLNGLASKAIKAKESCGSTSDKDCSDEDKLSFILRKIQSMLKHKR
ncbi:hypothetical protein CR513_04654, partial [Mucuna pruriens]